MKTGRQEDGKTGRREDEKVLPVFPSSRLLVFSSSLLLVFLSSSCGKKAPPRAPLNMAPAAPQNAAARRLGDTIYLQLTVPDKGMSGGEFSVDHLDVYAMTVAPGTAVPPTRGFLTPDHVIAHIPVQPPVDPDAAEPETPDPRPKQGDTIFFVEKIGAEQLTPTPIPPAKDTANASSATAARKNAAGTTSAAAPAAPAGPAALTRFYMVMGVPKKGRGAVPSARLEVPLLEAPGAPRPGTITADEQAVTLTWQPPPSSSDEAPGVAYNVYKDTKGTKDTKERPPVPLNPAPLTEATFTHPGAEPGTEQCFVVRSVATVGTAAIESDPSSPICITPKDTFPPAAPKGLAAVASTGVVNLIWDANSEADLAGYIVLRGDAADATLQPLIAEPIKETRYSDRTASPGVRYAYQIVAVDKAGNRSAPSNRVEEAAR